MSPTAVERAYVGAALLLAAFGVLVGIGAAVAGEDTSDWWGLLAVTGPLIVGALWLERHRSPWFSVAVVAVGITVGVITFWSILSLIVALVLLGTGLNRWRRKRGVIGQD